MATTTDQHKLIVSLEARMRSYEKAIEKAQAQTNQRMKGIETALKRPQQEMDRVGQAAQRMEARLSKVGGALRNFGAGFLGGIAAGGVAGIAATLASVANGIARIGDEARKAGLSAKAFQEWRYVAEQSRIPVDAMTDAFKELAIRADEFALTGKGSAAEAFARLGMSPEEVQSKLRNPSALMLELIERTKALRNTAAGVRIFDELFGGTGGERLVSLLHQGEGAIRDKIKAANDLGMVMDDAMIAKADELDRKFRAITTTVSSGLKSAIVAAAGALQDFIDRFRDVGARQTATLQTQLAEAERNLTAARERGIMPAGARQQQIDHSQAEVDRLRAVLRDRALQSVRPQLESLAAGGVAAKGDRLGYAAPVTSDKSKTGGRASSADAADREAQAVRRLIAELEHELALVGASSVEKEIANTLRRAGVDASSAEGQKIAELVRQIDAETEALKRNEEAQKARTQALDSLFQMGSDALISIADGSLKAEDAVKRLAVQLALAAAQAALLGTGPLAGLFGGGFFGGRAPEMAGGVLGFIRHGGTSNMQPGGAARMVPASTFAGAPRFHNGLKGNELAAILERGEAVLTQRQAMRTAGFMQSATAAMKSGGGSYVDSRVFNIDARGAQQGVGAEIQEALMQYDREVLPARVNQIANDPYAIG